MYQEISVPTPDSVTSSLMARLFPQVIAYLLLGPGSDFAAAFRFAPTRNLTLRRVLGGLEFESGSGSGPPVAGCAARAAEPNKLELSTLFKRI